jgi:hypothetical protein
MLLLCAVWSCAVMHLALIVLFLYLAVAFPGLTPCYIS